MRRKRCVFYLKFPSKVLSADFILFLQPLNIADTTPLPSPMERQNNRAFCFLPSGNPSVALRTTIEQLVSNDCGIGFDRNSHRPYTGTAFAPSAQSIGKSAR